MNSHPPSLILFIVSGIFGYTTVAVILLSLAALLIRRRRRALIVSISILSRVVVVTGGVCGLIYLSEGLPGPGIGYYRLQFFANIIAPQLFWFRRSRTNAWLALALATVISAPAVLLNIERIPAAL